MVRNCYPHYAPALKSSPSLVVTLELSEVLDDFAEETLTATYAVRRGVVEGVWIDLLHNYIAVLATKANAAAANTVWIISLEPNPLNS